MATDDLQGLEHDLHPYLTELAAYHSTKALEESPLYRELRPKIHRVLQSLDISPAHAAAEPEPFYRCVAWNIERGMRWEAIRHHLKTHPVLATADILLITEADLGMARSGNRHVARELARELGMNYFFAPSYLNLAKGCGIEQEAQGENHLGIAGNAILSRYPIESHQIVRLPNALDKMRGREKRLGSQTAPLAMIRLGNGGLSIAAVHLDMRSTPKHRRDQLAQILRAVRTLGNGPALIGGDWNTSTYRAHRPVSAIVGFWIRVFMGTHNMVHNHYPHPNRLFERRLFRMVEASGFDYRGCNETGVGTNHYSVEDIKQFKNLREWIPNWCFRFIEWSLRDHGGRCSFKLDWFAQRGLHILKEGEASSFRKGFSIAPQVVGNLIFENYPASDHDAIAVDFTFPSPSTK